MKPMLFNTDMVRALLDGRKSVTRRVAFPENDLRAFPREDCPDGWWFRGRAYRNWDDAMREPQGVMSLCHYRPGDILYVRETWAECEDTGGYLYRAWPKFEPEDEDDAMKRLGLKWRPSIHMPKEAARLFLRVTDVRVERLQEITEERAVAEGVYRSREDYGIAIYAFSDLWDSTIKKADLPRYGWAANPWVWVIAFERISGVQEGRKCK